MTARRPAAAISRWRARALASGLVISALLLPLAAYADPSPAVVFLVRHAEKQAMGEDPALSEAGRRRAEALARMLTDAGVRAVYSTDYARTRNTGAPLAALLGLGLTLYNPEKLEELAADLRRDGGRCLVVGHSNTTPELVGLLGGDPGPPIDEGSEYDRLYVVTIGQDGAVSTIVLRY